MLQEEIELRREFVDELKEAKCQAEIFDIRRYYTTKLADHYFQISEDNYEQCEERARIVIKELEGIRDDKES
jgi:hypothetical protein